VSAPLEDLRQRCAEEAVEATELAAVVDADADADDQPERLPRAEEDDQA